jgi:hypothetical protein
VALLWRADGCPFADVHYNKICSNNRASFTLQHYCKIETAYLRPRYNQIVKPYVPTLPRSRHQFSHHHSTQKKRLGSFRFTSCRA